MPRTASRTATAPATAPLPDTIAGLRSLCALVPLKSRTACGEAADLCARFSVRRLNAGQREYFRELLALVEDYEDEHQESVRAGAGLRKAAPAKRTKSA